MENLTYKTLKNLGIFNLMKYGFNLYIEDGYGHSMAATYNPDRDVYVGRSNIEISKKDLMDCIVTAIIGDWNTFYSPYIQNVPAVYVLPTKEWLKNHSINI